MLYIYILELESNKYYIGKTTNPAFRLENHFDGNASVWTNKYKPIKLIEFISDCDSFDEDKYTLKYMEIYGIDNVRGGSFCQIILNQENLNTINKMIKNSTSKDIFKSVDTKYNNYLKNFNNIVEINKEINFLEKQIDYVINLYNIKKSINNDWKNTISFYNEQINNVKFQINQMNQINQNYRQKGRNDRYNYNHENEAIKNFILGLVSTSNETLTQNNLDEIFENFCLIIDNEIAKNFSRNILKYIKSDFVGKIILDQFINRLNHSCQINKQNLQSTHNENISNAYIDLDIFEKINNFNNYKVKLNKLYLFLLQIENELEEFYKLHQVKDFESFEFEINKKMEIITDKIIKIKENKNNKL